jgi:8-oxo-dGTP diphosphatase
MSEGQKRAATFCILLCGDLLLLLKRAKEPHKGKYVPVGGKIEPFETPMASVIRETYEETGIKITNPTYCGVLVETSSTPYNWISFVYKSEIDYIPTPYCNEGVLKWIHYKDLLNYPSPKTDLLIYEFIKVKRMFALHALYDSNLELLEMKDELTGESF